MTIIDGTTGAPMPVPAAPSQSVIPTTRIGQATAIEQARAVAEVHAAMVMARDFPRNEASALAAVQQSCNQQALAERAFYRFARGGSTVSGETIDLARELARCWRNIDYGIKELSRDDVLGQSEMQAYAWDLEANTRVTNTFIVPHKRDKRGGPERLVDLRDIYENNTNNASRRVRECIFGVLPPYLKEKAKQWCTDTIKNGGGVPLPERIAGCLSTFAAIGVTTVQLETKIGRGNAEWTEFDVAQLRIIYTSIQRHEVTKDDEFPAQRVTAAEIKADAAAVGSEGWPAVATPPGGEPS